MTTITADDSGESKTNNNVSESNKTLCDTQYNIHTYIKTHAQPFETRNKLTTHCDTQTKLIEKGIIRKHTQTGCARILREKNTHKIY